MRQAEDNQPTSASVERGHFKSVICGQTSSVLTLPATIRERCWSILPVNLRNCWLLPGGSHPWCYTF